MQQTYLDAYNPGNPATGLTFYGYTPGNLPVLGKNASYAEQYYNGNEFLLPGLATTIPNAVNFNVSGYGIPPNVDAHSWPYVWYDNSVLVPTSTASAGGTGYFGFAQSVDYAGHIPQYGTAVGGIKLIPGSTVWLPSGFQYNATQYGTPVDLLGSQHISVGTVEAQGVGVVLFSATSTATSNGTLPTGSPSILTDQITFNTLESLLSLSGQFVNDPDGLLSVYFDGNLITQLDETDAGSSLWTLEDIYLGADEPAGIHTLMLRLDPFDGFDTSVDISNVQFGETVAVPEPSNLLQAAFGAVFLFSGIRSGRRRLPPILWNDLSRQ